MTDEVQFIRAGGSVTNNEDTWRACRRSSNGAGRLGNRKCVILQHRKLRLQTGSSLGTDSLYTSIIYTDCTCRNDPRATVCFKPQNLPLIPSQTQYTLQSCHLPQCHVRIYTVAMKPLGFNQNSRAPECPMLHLINWHGS